MATTAPTTLELQSLPTDGSRLPEHDHPSLNTTSAPPSTNEFPSLPPVDTGKQAWLFLAACWGVEAVTFGTVPSPYFLSLTNHRQMQASASPSASSKTTTPRTRPSPAPPASPQSAPPQPVSSTSAPPSSSQC